MVIIFEKGGEFWIESFVNARSNVNAAATKTVNFTLTKSGIFIGCSVTVDSDSNRQDVGVRNIDDSEITYGQVMTTIRAFARNQLGTAAQIGFKVIIFMRGRGAGSV